MITRPVARTSGLSDGWNDAAVNRSWRPSLSPARQPTAALKPPNTKMPRLTTTVSNAMTAGNSPARIPR